MHLSKVIPLSLAFLLGISQPADVDLPVSTEDVARILESLPEAVSVVPIRPRQVLVYSRTWGFRHSSIPAGVKAMQLLGQKTRAFTAIHSEDPSMFDVDNLTAFDAVIMLNTTGDCLATQKGSRNP